MYETSFLDQNVCNALSRCRAKQVVIVLESLIATLRNKPGNNQENPENKPGKLPMLSGGVKRKSSYRFTVYKQA